MKLRIVVCAFLAVAMVMASAKIRKTDNKKTAKKTETVEQKADTISKEEFSFYMGVAQIGGLKNYLAQRMNVDTLNNMDDFIRGLQESMKAPESKKLVAYSAGLQIGQQIMKPFLDQINQQITGEPNKSFIDVEQYKKGFLAAITGNGLTISVDSATTAANAQMAYYKNQLMEQKYGANRKAGEEWLANNAKQSGVKTLPCGVQYKVLVEGKGPKPTDEQTIKVNYEGKLIDGTIFDSSYKRNQPMTFKCNQVIKGWSEAIQQMPVGSTWEIYIPQELAYGAREAGQIKPFSALIFKVELLEIVPEKTAEPTK